MLSINTNLSSLIAQRSMKSSTNALNQAIERMTTGYKINHSRDNAANYSIATNMDTKIGAYNVAEDNAAMGLDMITTANESLNLIQDKLTRLRDLQEQASNGTYGEQSLKAINSEANALVDEINRLYEMAEYNGIKLFGADGATPAQASEPIATFGLARSTTETSNPSYTDNYVDGMVTMTELVDGILSPTSEYSISTEEELVALADYVNANNDTTGMTFVLRNDIEMTSVFTPIGIYLSNQFKGVFDGNGHVIKNLKTSSSSSYALGLFGYAAAGSILRNVGLENVDLTGTQFAGPAGALVGSTDGDVINCFSSGTINARSSVGGLIGSSYGNVTNCYSTVNINTNGLRDDGNFVGGLIGYSRGNVTNCYATGNVRAYQYFGGFVGQADGPLTNCYSTGTAYNDSTTYGGGGGFAGWFTKATSCYAIGTGNSQGGFVAYDATYNMTDCASVQSDIQATQMTEAEILAKYTPEYMGFTEANGWTIVDGRPRLFWEDDAQAVRPGGGVIETIPGIDPDGGGSDPVDPDAGGGTGGTTGSQPSYAPGSIVLQVGVGESWSSQVGVDLSFTLNGIDDLRGIGIDKVTDYFTILDDMLSTVAAKQVTYGAAQNRLESALDEIETQRTNLVSSRSTLRDADISDVSSQYIKQQILQQASATLMATANQSPSIALQLI